MATLYFTFHKPTGSAHLNICILLVSNCATDHNCALLLVKLGEREEQRESFSLCFEKKKWLVVLQVHNRSIKKCY